MEKYPWLFFHRRFFEGLDFPTLCPQEWDPGPGAFFGGGYSQGRKKHQELGGSNFLKNLLA